MILEHLKRLIQFRVSSKSARLVLVDFRHLSHDGIKNGNKIGIRAENITIVPEGKGRLSCSVTEAEFLGSETLIGLEHEGTTGLNVLQPGLSIVPSGQRIDITFDDQDLHIFNSAGDRINGQ